MSDSDSESEGGSARARDSDCWSESEPEFRAAESTRDPDLFLALPAGECPSLGMGGRMLVRLFSRCIYRGGLFTGRCDRYESEDSEEAGVYEEKGCERGS